MSEGFPGLGVAFFATGTGCVLKNVYLSDILPFYYFTFLLVTATTRLHTATTSHCHIQTSKEQDEKMLLVLEKKSLQQGNKVLLWLIPKAKKLILRKMIAVSAKVREAQQQMPHILLFLTRLKDKTISLLPRHESRTTKYSLKDKESFANVKTILKVRARQPGFEI